MRAVCAGLLIFFIATMVSGFVSAESTRQWDVSFQVQSGQNGYWVSPEPLDPGYLRYYLRTDLHTVVEMWAIIWIVVNEGDDTGFSETWGPIPPAGRVITQEHIEADVDGIFIALDMTTWVDGDYFLHVDIENFTATTPMRVTATGTARVLETDTVYGDLVADDWLDGQDVLLYAHVLAGNETTPALWLADMDSDGYLHSRDLVLIQNFVVGNAVTAYVDWIF
ncbi:MAG: hypothetical protein JXQ27_13930 [Acidobacteria bacterium]|nr:hypothetical protein [Acidobacteriota bacterium]